MAKQFEYYYLQRNNGSTWDTLEQSGAVTTLTSDLNDRMATLGGAGLRIVGANFNEASGAWSYEQLFYIDPSTVDLTLADRIRALVSSDKGESGGATLANLASTGEPAKVSRNVTPAARSAIH